MPAATTGGQVSTSGGAAWAVRASSAGARGGGSQVLPAATRRATGRPRPAVARRRRRAAGCAAPAPARRASCSRLFSVRRGPPRTGRSRSPPRRGRSSSRGGSASRSRGPRASFCSASVPLPARRQLRRPPQRHWTAAGTVAASRCACRQSSSPWRSTRASPQATNGCASARAASSGPAISVKRLAGGACRPCCVIQKRSTLRRRSRGQRAQRRRREHGAPARPRDVGGGQRIEQPLRGGRVARGTRHGDRRGRPARADLRQHLEAQVVAVELPLRVAVVLDEREVPGLHPGGSSRRVSGSSGRTSRPRASGATSGMAASPAMPAPRSSCSSTVSS